MSLAQLGRFTEAAEYVVEALRLAEPIRNVYAAVQAHRAEGMLYLLQGDWAKARPAVEHGIAAIREGNLAFFLPDVVAISAWVLAQLGETQEALDRIREGEQLLDRHAARGLVGRLGSGYQALGRACLLLGQVEETRRLGNRSVEYSPRHPGFAADAFHLLGDAATHPAGGDADRGEAHYRQAMALAEPRGMKPLMAHCHLSLSKLYRRTGNLQEAQEHLIIATAMYREMDMRFYLEQAEAEIALGTDA
jgi:tetratricopeptide (TPR) repeat protein